ncbi:MAG: GrpB family protein [Solobacterium sp.]|nr:GrpB family protein [Solobacterium sp.]
MGKDPAEMTLEELWELFPVFLVEHDDGWKDSFNEIAKTLTGLLADQPAVRISHVGSTAIPEIWAKNIVDVMVEIPQRADMKDAAQILEQNGFIIMSSGTNRISLNQGYRANGFADKVYHIHLRYAGDNDELYFRDYLNEHPGVAKEYETLKFRLWKQYEHNRDAYTDAKTDFISRWTAEARKEYGDRYG